MSRKIINSITLKVTRNIQDTIIIQDYYSYEKNYLNRIRYH